MASSLKKGGIDLCWFSRLIGQEPLYIEAPPSILRLAPETNDAAGDNKKQTAAETYSPFQ